MTPPPTDMARDAYLSLRSGPRAAASVTSELKGRLG